jgi:hypothetical protein
MPSHWLLRGETLDWTELAKTIGTTTVALGVIGYFLRGVFSQVLSRDLEKFKADLSAKHEIEIERLRNDLRIAASEHETRFTRLHETRAQAVAELYRRLVVTCSTFEWYLSTGKPGAAPDDIKNREMAWKEARDFAAYFNEKRIYFDQELCGDIDVAIESFRRLYLWVGVYPQEMADSAEKWVEGAKHFIKHFPLIRAKIERQFRELIGVQKTPGNEKLVIGS